MMIILRTIAILIVLAGTAHAQATLPLTKAAQITQLGNCFPTQTSGLITPAVTVECLTSIVNSYQQYPIVNPQTGTSYTFQTTDYGQLVTFNSSSPVVVTLPQATGSFSPWNVYVHDLGSAAVTITPVGSTINGSSSLALTTGQSVWIVSDGTNYQTANTGTGGSANLTIGTTSIAAGTTNGLLYDNGGALGNLATANSGVLITSGSGVPSISTALPSAITIPSPVLTGSPSGAGSSITINSTSCTLGGSCTVAVALGIGSTVITSGTTNGLLYDNGGLVGNLATAANGILITSSGSVPSISSTLPSTVQGNITTTGTLTAGATGSGFTVAFGSSTLTGQVPLTNGGTAASLTASNGGIVYSTGSAFAILSGTSTASQCLLSGSSAAPTWGSCSGAAAVSSVTANANSTLTISPNTGAVVAGLNLGNANTWTAAQTFPNSGVVLLGSSTGATTFTSANASATNYTITVPAVTSTLAVLGLNQTFTATETFSGTLNVSGTFQIGGTTVALPVSLANGGTAASLTASNGGIVYSTGSAFAILSGTATAGQCLLSGSNAAPTWNSCSSTSVTSLNALQGVLTLSENGGGTVTSSGSAITLGNPGGYLNRFRNGTFDVWQRGTSGLTAYTTLATPCVATADGWCVQQTGAAFTCAQTGQVNIGGAQYALRCVGGAGNTDTKIVQRIESYVTAPLVGKTVTVQFYYQQSSGSTITPKISSCYASAQDNFATCTSDLAATSITACATATWCQEAYTFTVSASAFDGYQVTVDCNTALIAAQYCYITAADIRVTPGVATGVNTNAPPAELRPIQPELVLCQRYYTIGGIALNGEGASPYWTSLNTISMRATPTIVYSSPSGANYTGSFASLASSASYFITQLSGNGSGHGYGDGTFTASAEL